MPIPIPRRISIQKKLSALVSGVRILYPQNVKPKNTNIPPATRYCCGIPFCKSWPIMGIIKAVVNAAGIINAPDCWAVHPSVDCVYKGIINVEPYNPKPMIKDKIVPTRKLPFFKTLNSTMGCFATNSLHTKKYKPSTAVMVKKIIVPLLNQSSSCPLSKTYCSEPTAIARKPMPSQSISLNNFFAPNLGLRTNCSVNNAAITPMGIFM